MSSAEKKRIREAFRRAVLDRDGHRCRVCGVPEAECPLDPHHITPRQTMPAGGYVPENGIALCDRPGGCHEKAEARAPGWSPARLYALIGSSERQAYLAAQALRTATTGAPRRVAATPVRRWFPPGNQPS